MNNHQVICYKINKSIKPCDVISATEEILDKHSVVCKSYLFSASVDICEYEYEGKWHTNRSKNAVNAIIKRHPQLKDFFKTETVSQEQQGLCERFYISNLPMDNNRSLGRIEYDVIREIAMGTPRPYSLNELDITFGGISLGADAYIRYTRSCHGSEKHSYVYFAADSTDIDKMRNIFFEFTNMIPGKYVVTDI